MSLLLAAAMAGCVAQPVDLAGDEPAVRPLRETLARRGVALGPGTAACPALAVGVREENAAWTLTRTDDAGRTDARTVRDLELAGALVETWLARDLAAPLLVLAQPAPPPEPPPRRTPERRAGPALALAAELGRNDRAGWERGVAARGSWALGPMAPEATLRYAAVDPTLAPSGAAEHWLVEALAGVRVPLALGPVQLLPGAAGGLGLDGSARGPCDGCARLVSDGAWAAQLQPRAEASLGATIDLGAALALEASCAASFTPFARGAPMPDWAGGPGTEAFALAAPPRARLRIGLGISWRPE